MEGVFDKQATQMLFDSENVSQGPGMYRLEKAQKENKPAFPWQEGVNFDFRVFCCENTFHECLFHAKYVNFIVFYKIK